MANTSNDASGTAPYRSAHDLPSFVEMRQQLKALKALTLIMMRGKRSEIAELETRMNEMADRVDAFCERLGIVHGSVVNFNNIIVATKRVESARHPHAT